MSSATTTQTASYFFPVQMNTVLVAEYTDWPWVVTTTGVGQLSSVAASFTQTTVTLGQSSGTVPFSILITAFSRTSIQIAGSDSFTFTTTSATPTSSVTQSITSFSQTTTTSTTQTSTTSTYNIGGPSSAAATIPYSNTTSTATISYTTSRTTSFSFTRTTTATSGFTISSFTQSTTTVTSQSTFISTNASGTVPTTVTFSSKGTSNTFTILRSSLLSQNYTATSSGSGTLFGGTQTASASETFSSGISIGASATSITASLAYAQDDSVVAPTPTVTQITIGQGYQVWPNIGRGFPFGTNMSANFSLIIPQDDGAFGTSLRTPELDGATVAVEIAGLSMTSQWFTSDSRAHVTYKTAAGTSSTTLTVSVVTTGTIAPNLSNTAALSAFGGWGWDSTANTSFTNTRGVHSATIVDGSSFTTTELSWGAASSFQVSSGQAVALKAIPLASSSGSSVALNPFLNFSRFPVP